ncbi:peptide-N4-(N-acetyl-beta- glucosaminyl)asparagine amidase [Clonorchis sinensis]|uniref:Peptide-N4-(N-acetyl-beta-glucosaminyl)asparagine amidase n=1 Tax=Clonorchis sinensis TaxID=79923 RepID=A0A8T1M992_CLOSI|nr:peptide-N4-(N-acetyl-beta- glucosaminyl)asparagine amidase [Clonorchis sinensis]
MFADFWFPGMASWPRIRSNSRFRNILTPSFSKNPQNSDEITKEVARNKDKLIVLFFHTSGYKPFEKLEEKLAKIEADDNGVVFLNVDVTAHTQLMYEYNIKSNPTFIFLKNGAQVHSYTQMDEAAIIDLVNKYKEKTQKQGPKNNVSKDEHKPINTQDKKVRKIDSKKQLDAITKRNANKLIIIDFYTAWCNPCKILAPVYEKLSAEFQSVVFLKVDGDASKELREQFQVKSYPTFVLLKNGQNVESFGGASEDTLRQKIAQHKP